MILLGLVALAILVIESLQAPAEPATAIDPGDVLELRLGGPPPEGSVEGVDHYVVQRGDTLSGIAEALFGDPRLAAQIARLNGLADPDDIVAGQVLRLR